MDLNTAVALEGYLEKQSPNIISIFQRRYFTFRSKGQFLVWFKKKPASVADEPKGFIKVADIQSILSDISEPLLLHLKYPQRTFVLRAQTKASRDRWALCIQTIKKHFNHLDKAKGHKVESSERSRGWRWAQAKGDEVQVIRVQNEKAILNDGEDSLHQNAVKFQLEVMGVQIPAALQKNILFGYLNRKHIIRSQTRWFFLCSEYNLTDIQDQQAQDPTELLANASKTITLRQQPTKKHQSSSDSQQQKPPQPQGIRLQINTLYEFDINTKLLINSLPLVEILTHNENLSEPPYSLTITHLVFSQGDQLAETALNFDEQQKQLQLYCQYQTELTKWNKAISICFKKYGLAAERERLLEERFVRFKARMFRCKKDEDWRIIGTEQKPEYLYLNCRQIKIAGHSFSLRQISSSLKSEKIKLDEQDQSSQAGCSFDYQCQSKKQKATIVFYLSEDERTFRKRAKKFIKKLEPVAKSKQERQLQIQVEENNLNTYFIDKKIRQSSSKLRINFYEMMEMESIPTTKARSPPKQLSVFDKFLSMFCSSPIEQKLYE